MKKISVLSLMTVTIIIFSNCHSAKKVTAPRITYESNIQTLVMNNCTPCHIPSKGGNKKALDRYDSTKANIDEMIRRISLNPEEKGFMPFKHPKLDENTIAIFKQWRTQGTPEK